MCVEVHPYRVNKTIRLAVSAVMDYLEILTSLLDNFTVTLKLTKISVGVVACFLLGSRGRHHSGVIVRETWMYIYYLILVFVVQD